MNSRKDLFDFMMKQVKRTADANGDRLPQAFGRWFARMFFSGVSNIVIPDGAGDGKVDLLVTCTRGHSVEHKILNTKFTTKYDHGSPVSFYDEITRFWQAFENKANRAAYLENVVRDSLRSHYKRLFKLYDEGAADLYFVTDHRVNAAQYRSVKGYDVKVLHLDEVLLYTAEHIEGAMPETDPLLLSGISNVLTPATNESEVPTSIVFARLVDFISYMESDPFDLLFARNVRLWLGNTEANKDIQETFREAPKEFAYSNNGITILCRKHTHDPGKQELRLENPRVVNGSQTLHSIRNVENPSRLARAMVRVIEVPPGTERDLPDLIERRKEVIHKIAVRSNVQNPIKRWNLVANDDFQNELARFFWERQLYYERRQGEWKMRKDELSGVKIKRGPDIRWLTQLVASHYYSNRKLGPAIAQGRLNLLFEGDAYKAIRQTPPTVAFDLYLLGEAAEGSLRRLADRKKYIANVRGYVDLSTIALLSRALREAGLAVGTDAASRLLAAVARKQLPWWDNVVRLAVDQVVTQFDKEAARVLRRDGKPLTVANFFKSSTMIDDLLRRPLPGGMRQALVRALRDLRAR